MIVDESRMVGIDSKHPSYYVNQETDDEVTQKFYMEERLRRMMRANTDSDMEYHPWLALVKITKVKDKSSDKEEIVTCTGTLLNARFVLTAALFHNFISNIKKIHIFFCFASTICKNGNAMAK